MIDLSKLNLETDRTKIKMDCWGCDWSGMHSELEERKSKYTIQGKGYDRITDHCPECGEELDN